MQRRGCRQRASASASSGASRRPRTRAAVQVEAQVQAQHVAQRVERHAPPRVLPGVDHSGHRGRRCVPRRALRTAKAPPPSCMLLRSAACNRFPPHQRCPALPPHPPHPRASRTCDTGANTGCCSSLASPLPARQAPNSSSARAAAPAAVAPAAAPPPAASASTACLKKKGAARPAALDLQAAAGAHGSERRGLREGRVLLKAAGGDRGGHAAAPRPGERWRPAAQLPPGQPRRQCKHGGSAPKPTHNAAATHAYIPHTRAGPSTGSRDQQRQGGCQAPRQPGLPKRQPSEVGQHRPQAARGRRRRQRRGGAVGGVWSQHRL